ncbi:metallophosphoesterase family protein [Streptomyces sp. NPDC085900]|uniref:metallophosphoesterase family protein n=1 Tax=Streptomyces sp. NPDC085900 TaxID=3365737 RepID=UPI0037CF1A00
MNGARGRLLAVSDLHVAKDAGRPLVQRLRPGTDDDWLLVAGDVGERFADVEWALRLLRDRFSQVVWAPGNRDLSTGPDDPVQLRGEERYRALVALCRTLGVTTPEDPYPIWPGPHGPFAIVPLFLLYDHSFRDPATASVGEAVLQAHEAGVVCPDEFLLHTEPFAGPVDWCHARVRATRARLDALDPSLPTVLVNHFPLIREPTEALPCRELAQWCGTDRTRDWHRRYRAAAVVYGHLHIPRTSWHDGVPFQEVSLGHPRDWRHRAGDVTGVPRIVRLAEPDRQTAGGTAGRAGEPVADVSRYRRRPVDTPWSARRAG